MPAVFFFLIDVSMNAIQTGATAAACSAINQVISDLPVSYISYAVYCNILYYHQHDFTGILYDDPCMYCL